MLSHLERKSSSTVTVDSSSDNFMPSFHTKDAMFQKIQIQLFIGDLSADHRKYYRR